MTDTETALDIIEEPTLSDESQKVQPEPEEAEATSEETKETETESEETTEESVEEPAEDAEVGDDAAEDVKPKRRRNAQKRISELTRARHEAERRAQQAEQQLRALQVETTPATVPKPEDFPSHDEYEAARFEFHAAHAVRTEVEKAGQVVQQTQQKSEQTARAADWEIQMEEARDKYDDFNDVVLDPGNTFFTETIYQALSDDENGTDVAYHLASHPKLGREIAALSPMKAVLRIGKLSAKLSEKPTPKPTSAPAPVRTVKSGSAPVGLTPQTARNMDDYIKARQGDKP